MSVFTKTDTEGSRGGWPTPGKRRSEQRKSTWDTGSRHSVDFLDADAGFDWKSFLEEAEAAAEEDDGFNIRQLLISLSSFSLGCQTETREEEKIPLPPVNRLIACIKRVMMRSSNTLRQEKLQDLLLEWLQPPKRLRPAKEVDLDAFVQAREDFWDMYKASTTKWEGLGTTAAAFAKGPPSPQRSLDAVSGVAMAFFPNVDKKSEQKLRSRSQHQLSNAVLDFQKECERRPVTAPAALEAIVGKSEVLPRKKPPDLYQFPPGFDEPRGARPSKMGLRSLARPTSASELIKRGACQPCIERVEPSFPASTPKAKRFAREHLLTKPKLKKEELYLASSIGLKLHPYSREELLHKVKPSMCTKLPTPVSKSDVRRKELSGMLLPASPTAVHSKTLPRDKGARKQAPNTGLYDSEPTLAVVQTPVWRYFKECDLVNAVPRRPRFLVDAAKDAYPEADSPEFRDVPYVVSVRNQAMRDQDLVTFSQPLHVIETGCINIDLAHNAFSDAGVAAFLAQVSKNDVRSLDLSHSGAAGESVAVILRKMERGWARLYTLQLGGRGLSDESWRSLCNALIEHGSIRRLDLVDMSLGKLSQSAIKYVMDLASTALYLEHLDLTGNFFLHDGFEMLADAVRHTKSIRFLDVSHNASTAGVIPRRNRLHRGTSNDENPQLVKGPDGKMYEDLPNFHPAALLCEALIDNKSLRELRLASSWLDFTVDCVLLNSLLRNNTLQTLDLGDNPHGEDGLRAILRLMMHPSQTLTYCEVGGFREGGHGPGVVPLEFGAPTGRYKLELKHPQNRAVVQWLFRIAENIRIQPPESAFAISQWSGRPKPWFEKTERGVDVATHGHLSFDFSAPVHLDSAKSAEAAVTKWLQTRRVPVTLSRFVPLIAMVDGLDTTEQQGTLVKAIGDTCMLKTVHLKKLVHSCPSIADIVVRTLYPHIYDSDPLLLFSVQIAHSNLGRSFRHEARGLFFLNLQNPTNHYTLHLSRLMDLQVAQRLHIVNRYEAAVALRSCGRRSDTSQHGNFEGARNIVWQDEKSGKKTYKSFVDFIIPSQGVLSFDYVSPPPCSPSRKTKTMDSGKFEQLMHLCELSHCGPQDKVMALRNSIHSMVLDLTQIRMLCEAFPNPAIREACSTKMCPPEALKSAFQYRMINCRIEAFILLFNFCNDAPTLCTSELQWNLRLFTMACAQEIRLRLGTARTMDALHCCQLWGVPPEECPKTWDTYKCNAAFVKARRREEADGGPGALYKKSPSEIFKLAKLEPGCRYVLDLAMHEDWAVARFLVAMSEAEEGLNRSMALCDWTGRGAMQSASQHEYKVDFFVPSTWLNEVPQKGIFTCTYLSESQDRINTNERRSLAEKYLGWESLRA